MTPDTLLGTITRTGDDAEVTFDRVYDTDAGDLWESVTDQERLARWFARVDGDLREGGRFTIHFDDDDVPDCRVTSCDAPRGYTWEWSHATHASLLTVAVEPAADGARLRLTHTRLSASSAAGYAAGWDATFAGSSSSWPAERSGTPGPRTGAPPTTGMRRSWPSRSRAPAWP